MDLNIEEWRDIPGFEGYYQANTTGKRVQSLQKNIEKH